MKILEILSESKDKNEDKVKDPKTGKACWDGYKRHPKIKSGKGSCVKIKENEKVNE